MNTLLSPLLLLGVGGAGAAMVRGILRAYGPGIRALVLDTDATSGGTGDVPFMLLGGNRLAGRGTGGQAAVARAAFQDTPSILDTSLEGVRTVVIVTALGGGTGGGATSEILKHLHTLGIVTLLFTTFPFAFEGDERLRAARTAASLTEQHADVSVALPLDELVAGTGQDTLKDALVRGVNTLSAGVTLLWRLLEKPGYIRLDAEHLRTILTGCGRAFFATSTAQGPDRDEKVLAALAENPLLRRDDSAPRIRTLLIGILAGNDLRLSEIASLSGGLSAAFGPDAAVQLGTVNDEDVFSGRLTVVLMLFEESATTRVLPAAGGTMPRRNSPRTVGDRALTPDSRFRNAEHTFWNDEDLDIPTYVRRSLTLDR